MSEVNAAVLDTLVSMNEGVPERSGLDAETFMLVRIAALASTGAPPASYLLNLQLASDVGLTVEQVQGVPRWWGAPVWPAPAAPLPRPMDLPQQSPASRSRAGRERSDR